MALYHCSVKFISRRQGRCSVSAAAYRSGEKLYNQYDGQTYDFTNKKGIVHKEILLPDTAPREFLDRQTLWNSVEAIEKRVDSRTAREVEISLPRELTLPEQIKVTRRYANANFVRIGMCADFCIHDKRNGNPHAHVLLTTRHVDENGFGKKNRNWDKRENVEHWREAWAKELNQEFERKALEVRVSHESYIRRGLDRTPLQYLSRSEIQLEKLGIMTDRIKERQRQKRFREKEYEYEREQDFELSR